MQLLVEGIAALDLPVALQELVRRRLLEDENVVESEQTNNENRELVGSTGKTNEVNKRIW